MISTIITLVVLAGSSVVLNFEPTRNTATVREAQTDNPIPLCPRMSNGADLVHQKRPTPTTAEYRTSFSAAKHGFLFKNWEGQLTVPITGQSITVGAYCFGMCQAAIDYYTHSLDPKKDIDGKMYKNQVEPPPNLKLWIETRQGQQMSFNAAYGYPNFIKRENGIDIPGGLGRNIMVHGYKLLLEKIKAGKPWPIALYGRDPEGKLVGHAVVVYAIEESHLAWDWEHYSTNLAANVYSEMVATFFVYDPNSAETERQFAFILGKKRDGSLAGTTFRSYKGWDDRRYIDQFHFFWPVENFEARQPTSDSAPSSTRHSLSGRWRGSFRGEYFSVSTFPDFRHTFDVVISGDQVEIPTDDWRGHGRGTLSVTGDKVRISIRWKTAGADGSETMEGTIEPDGRYITGTTKGSNLPAKWSGEFQFRKL